jgi:Acyl-protein synthetase, LuxE
VKTKDLVLNMLEGPPFGLDQSQKQDLLLLRLRDLTNHHYHKSPVYRNILEGVFGGQKALEFDRVEDAPFLPVSLFKTHELLSVPSADVVKVLTSSGTTGQAVSKIFLDRDTAQLQERVLVKIVQHFLRKERLPMVIIDNESVIRNRQSYSARGAGILGMIQFGRRPFYALRDDMSLDMDGLLNYLEGAKSNRIFFFGFTYMVWQYFVLVLEQMKVRLNLTDSVLIHSGGWKKLQDLSVSAKEFRARVESSTGIQNTINFYGMVEQVGSVFFENDLHYLHASNYSDIIIRDPVTLKPLPDGEVGLVQLVSMLPTSYPGHSILTEDLGVIRGVDDPSLEMRGRFFEILGRVPRSELRGCSDTFLPAKVNSGQAILAD